MRASAALLLFSLFALNAPAARAQIAIAGESPYLYGIEDPGGAGMFEQRGKNGWIVFPETLGGDPKSKAGRDYSKWTDRGHGAIVRLSFGDAPSGTLPCPEGYPDFVSRVSSFVAASKGAHIWVIGDEMDLPARWPSCGGKPRPIAPREYAGLFLRVRAAIRALPGRESDQIVPGAVSWTSQETSSDTLRYQIELFAELGPNGADGAALHAGTTEHSPGLILSDAKMDGAYASRNAQFRAYQDKILALPHWAQSLPIYITRARPRAWTDANTGWVRAAYAEIDRWNSLDGNPKIHALVLSRWNGDIDGLLGVQQDLARALIQNDQW